MLSLRQHFLQTPFYRRGHPSASRAHLEDRRRGAEEAHSQIDGNGKNHSTERTSFGLVNSPRGQALEHRENALGGCNAATRGINTGENSAKAAHDRGSGGRK